MGETTTQPTAERKYPMNCHICDAVIPTERKVRELYPALLRESSFFWEMVSIFFLFSFRVHSAPGPLYP